MENKKLVSVIIPCYNSVLFLRQALESVLWQTYTEWECILVDDGSTDDSADIFKEYMKMDTRYVYHYQENGGLATARNAGIDLAKGDYIQFLDADDVLLQRRLEKCVAVFQTNPDFKVLYSEYMLFSKTMGFYKVLPSKIAIQDQLYALLFEFNKSFVIPIHSFFFRAEVVKKNKFDESLLSFAEDNEFRIRLALNGFHFDHMYEVLLIYRLNENQIISNEEDKIYENMLRNLTYFENNPKTQNYKKQFIEQRVYLTQRTAIAFFMKKQFRKGFKIFYPVLSKSSFRDILKVITWASLMIFISKNTFQDLRSWFFRTANLKTGGWKTLEHWDAPQSVKNLMNVS
ncbi:MAG: glycosyltransferase family 2 protein [bacterium]|nr:glycosyltransferase family 2 protein [bacterium]